MQAEPSKAPPGESVFLDIKEAFLLTYDTDNTPIAVPNMSLTFQTSGIEIAKPNGARAAVYAWNEIAGVSGVEQTEAPDGRSAIVMEIASSSKDHHFLIPAQEPESLISQIATLSPLCQAKRGKKGAAKKISPVMTGIAIVLVAAIVAVLLLISAGVLHF
jgi:hypothetical protein